MRTESLKRFLSILRGIVILVILFSTGYFLIEVFGILEWLNEIFTG